MSTHLQSRRTSRALRDGIVRIAELVATPLVPADYLDIVSPLRNPLELRGRIVAIRPETHDSVSVVIRPGNGWKTHTPGQYVRIGIDVEGVRQWRTYSLTSAPARADGCFAITVKALSGGLVSEHLVRQATPGTLVRLDQAQGEFVLTQELPAKLLLVAAGSGITPIMGILRGAPLDGVDVTVVHSARTPDDAIFAAELRSLARAGQLTLIERHTATDGRLDVAALAELVPDHLERTTYACGPGELLDLLEGHWSQSGISERLVTERFRSTIRVAGDGGTVRFARTGVDTDAGGATSLLDAGEAAGVLMPSGCRMGVCFGCVVPLSDGMVRDLRNGDLTTASPGDGVLIQTCVSAAAGPCDIDL